MLYNRRNFLVVLLKLSDEFILSVALLFSFWVVIYQREHINLGSYFDLKTKALNLVLFIMMLVSWNLVFNVLQLHSSRRLNNRTQEWRDILKGTILGTAIISLWVSAIFGVCISTFLFLIVVWLSSTILTISFRIFLRYVLIKVRFYGRNLRFLLIVGTNQRAYDFARKIEEKRELGYRLLGYVDDDIYECRKEVTLLGTLAEFGDIIRNNVVDEVVIALPIKSYYEEIHKIAQCAAEHGLIIRHFCNLFDTENGQWKPQLFDDFESLTMAFLPQDDLRYLAKRTIDMVLATLLIVALLPLMLVVAIIIKLRSRGPILFVQDRVGYHKRIFQIYKFRTMFVGAEKAQKELKDLNEMDGPVFKISNDPRITKIGRWLRKTSIDELPQLFNVFMGNMSLVGPRPLPVRDYNGFNKDWQRRRFSVLPGITCTWQISGRNTLSFEDWMKLDIDYVDNWKLSEDMKILCKTIPAAFKKEGAM